jgi:hypothetical protein
MLPVCRFETLTVLVSRRDESMDRNPPIPANASMKRNDSGFSLVVRFLFRLGYGLECRLRGVHCRTVRDGTLGFGSRLLPR